jgi:hypothetical protein
MDIIHMSQKMLSIAAILTAAVLTGIFSTTPMAAYAEDGDESETNTDQAIKQKNVGSGDSVNFNCAQNLIKAGVGQQQCGNGDGEIIIGLPEVLVPTTEVLLPLPFP